MARGSWLRRQVFTTAPTSRQWLDRNQAWADWIENAQLSQWLARRQLREQLCVAVVEATRAADSRARLEDALRHIR